MKTLGSRWFGLVLGFRLRANTRFGEASYSGGLQFRGKWGVFRFCLAREQS